MAQEQKLSESEGDDIHVDRCVYFRAMQVLLGVSRIPVCPNPSFLRLLKLTSTFVCAVVREIRNQWFSSNVTTNK